MKKTTLCIVLWNTLFSEADFLSLWQEKQLRAMWDPEGVKILILRTLCRKMDQECVYKGGEGVCNIKWIFPSTYEVPVWSLEVGIISDFPYTIAFPTFTGLQARRELQWALNGVPTLAFGVEQGAFLTSDAWSQWATYAGTWHMLLWVVESYHLLQWQFPMATTAVIAAAGDYGYTKTSYLTDWSTASWEMVMQHL